MTILVTCAFKKEWCNFAEDRLTDIGISSPLASSRFDLTAHDLVEKMSKSYKVSSTKSKNFRQVKPSKAWEISTADVFLENADFENWGWAHSNNLFFLTFWREFDDNCAFVLIYSGPEHSLEAEQSKSNDFEKNAALATERWRAYHSEMLRFYHENSDRSILIDLAEFEGTALEVSNALNGKFNLATKRINSHRRLGQDEIVALTMRKLLSENHTRVQKLHNELIVAADVETDPKNQDRFAALKEYQNIQDKLYESTSEVITLKKKVESLNAASNESEKKVKELTSQLKNKEKQIQTVEKANAELQKSAKKLAKDLSSAEHKASKAAKQSLAFSDENLLLLNQLDMVQQDLEKQHLDLKKLKTDTKKFEDALKAKSNISPVKTTTISIDFRQFINGKGWHNSEDIGRWGGPTNTHSLNLPLLEAGNYLLRMTVVDAMDVSILESLKIDLDGTSISSSLETHSNITGFWAPIRRRRVRKQNLAKPYPAELTAQFAIEPASSNKSQHMLTFEVDKLIQPSESGLGDQRKLSFCVSKLELKKI